MSDARLVAVTADPELIGRFIDKLAGEGDKEESGEESHGRLRLVTDGDE